jgi:hypothetical protein
MKEKGPYLSNRPRAGARAGVYYSVIASIR